MGDLTTLDTQHLQNILDQKNTGLINQIVDQEDSEQVKNLVNLFNLNHLKKQMVRNMTYNQLLDHIMDQMEERVTKRADQFSNKDLLDYMNAMGAAMDKAQKQITDIDSVPVIQVNQQNNIVNISEAESLDKESRNRVLDVVSGILSRIKESSENVQNLNPVSVYTDIDEPDANIALEEEFDSEVSVSKQLFNDNIGGEI